jgi:hypothetical protein
MKRSLFTVYPSGLAFENYYGKGIAPSKVKAEM